MKHYFIIMAVIAMSLCSCNQRSRLVILTEPTLYDMELNYIASFTPRLELVAAVKIVSDNLSVDAFLNNAMRESGVLTSDEVWANVKQSVETILSRNQDKKR